MRSEQLKELEEEARFKLLDLGEDINFHPYGRPGNQRLGLLKGSDPITYVTEWSCLSLLEEVERLLKEAIEEIEIHGHPW